MGRGRTPDEGLHYDFVTDTWIEGFPLRLYQEVPEQPLPAAEPAPGRWHAPEGPPPRPPRWHLPDRSRNAALAFLLTLLCLSTGLIPSFGASVAVPSLAAGVLLLALGLTSPYRYRLAQPIAEDRDVRLLEHPDDADVCLVEVTILRDGREVGRDRGAAWFEGGRVLFSGHRTSFALGGEDLVPRSQRRPRMRLTGSVLPLRVPWGSASVAFQALRYGASERPHETRFWSRLSTFAFFTPRSRGPRQWPPLPP